MLSLLCLRHKNHVCATFEHRASKKVVLGLLGLWLLWCGVSFGPGLVGLGPGSLRALPETVKPKRGRHSFSIGQLFQLYLKP